MHQAAENGTKDPAAIRKQLDAVLASPVFESAERSSRILRFVVEQTLAGRSAELKEYVIGVEALGRPESFDPRIDSIARVEVSRLRSRLEQYYATNGKNDPVIFELSRGSYIPKFELRQAAPEEPSHLLRSEASTKKSIWLTASAIVFVIASLAIAWWSWRAVDPTPGRALELDIALPDGVHIANVVGTQLAVSPDGSALVFVAGRAQGGSELWLRRMDRREVKLLPGTDGGRGPFFSPDSEWVGFWAGGKLKKISVRGGAPTIICDAPDLLGGSWGDDGQIVAALTAEAKLWRVSSGGGKPQAVLDLSSETARLLWPQVLAESRTIFYSKVGTTPDAGTVEALSISTGIRKVLVRSGSFGRYLPSGHLVYVNQGTLYAQKFSLRSLEARGNPVAVIAGVSQSPVFGFAQFDFSANGLLVYRRQAASTPLSLNWVAQSGTVRRLAPEPGSYLWPRASRDGTEAVYTAIRAGESRVWLARTGSLMPIAMTPEGSHYSAPILTPDSRFLLVQGQGTLEWLPKGKPATPSRLLTGAMIVPWSFSPDGKRLAFQKLDPATHFDLWTVPLESSGGALSAGKPEPFLQTKAVETYPAFSPDGKWIAYVSLQSGTYEVYVRAFPDNGREVQVSKSGGRLPAWSRLAQEIIYETEDHRIMVAPWRAGPDGFTAGAPKPWSNLRLADTGVLANFDLASDGRLLALLPNTLEAEPAEALSVSFNFSDELRRRLPQ